ncbi:MAG: 5-oxoprolinase subunit PxpB [Trueperaceae bacterium]|nr:5-oxoprolinase subunit PxpB [Trueperaceae bacterium]
MLQGFYLSFSETIDQEANASLQAFAQSLLEQALEGITDIIPGYRNIFIEYEDSLVTETSVKKWLESVKHAKVKAQPREVKLSVIYNGEDLAEISELTGLSRKEIIELHGEPSYQVYALGFTPGFPFMAELPEKLRLPRKAIPRKRVAAHSVAIAGAQTGIYPLASPGGWHLLGQTQEAVFDPRRQEPFLLQAGDKVRFIAGSGQPAPPVERLELLPETPARPVLKVQKPGLLDLPVDTGRFLVGRFGLARSGALDAQLASVANQLLGNPSKAVLLEMTLTGPVMECLEPCLVAHTGWSVTSRLNGKAQPPFSSFALKKGDVLSFEPTSQGVRSYLALAGGIESRQFIGSASVDLTGLIGRGLETGDVLGQAAETRALPGRTFAPFRKLDKETTIRIGPGPQASQELIQVLTSSSYSVLSADRMGIRLQGPALGVEGIISEAAPIGAVQVTSAGMPIILLNDRGTLGGYAKPALIVPQDLPKLAQLRPGQRLKFRAIST